MISNAKLSIYRMNHRIMVLLIAVMYMLRLRKKIEGIKKVVNSLIKLPGK